MKSGNYSLKELLTHNEIDQFIIPELQRDYVWQVRQVSGLWKSILKKFREMEEGRKRYTLKICEGEFEVFESKAITGFLQSKLDYIKYKQKLGFLYAYHDKEWAGKFFLIDGQQRITTLYLLLVALYLKRNRMSDFGKSYFKDKAPIVDYKVRESASEFLRLFLSDLINGRPYKENINYFIQDYEADQTVQNIQINFDYFVDELNQECDNDETTLRLIDYVENYIEFNYFDTNLSEQGEKLYLYMNSRGFKLSHQEILRAKLIEKCSNTEEKRLAAEIWEEMQNYFFENKGANPDADAGFEVFLNIASLLKKHEQASRDLQLDSFEDDSDEAKIYIDSLADSEKNKPYQIENLDIDFLSRVFLGLKAVLNIHINSDTYAKKYKEDYFKIVIDKSGKILEEKRVLYRYIPALYFHLRFASNPAFENSLLNKFVHFSVNQSHTSLVANKPAERIVHLLDLVKQMNHPDLLMSKDLGKNPDDHEREKLVWLNDREKHQGIFEILSDIYFDYNFQDLIEGDTELLFSLTEQYCGDKHNIAILSQVIEVIKKLFYINEEGEYQPDTVGTPNNSNKSSKLLRRYLLTYFDYKAYSGTSQGLVKYDLIRDNRQWVNRILRNKCFIFVIKNWLDKGIPSLKSSFEERKNVVGKDDWRYYFIRYKEVLDHTSKTVFVHNDNLRNIILMKGVSKSNEDIYLGCKLFTIRSNEGNFIFRPHKMDICYIDLIRKEENIIPALSSSILSLAVDMEYSGSDKWSASIFYRDESSIELRERIDSQMGFALKKLSASRFTNSKFDFIYGEGDLESETDRLYKHAAELIIPELSDLNLILSESVPLSGFAPKRQFV